MKILLPLAGVLLLVVTMPWQQRSESADIVFKNGNVYTTNDRAPRAEAIAVKADRIIFAGTNAAHKSLSTRTLVLSISKATLCCRVSLTHTSTFPASASAR